MRISEICIRRPVFATVLSLVLTLLGIEKAELSRGNGFATGIAHPLEKLQSLAVSLHGAFEISQGFIAQPQVVKSPSLSPDLTACRVFRHATVEKRDGLFRISQAKLIEGELVECLGLEEGIFEPIPEGEGFLEIDESRTQPIEVTLITELGAFGKSLGGGGEGLVAGSRRPANKEGDAIFTGRGSRGVGLDHEPVRSGRFGSPKNVLHPAMEGQTVNHHEGLTLRSEELHDDIDPELLDLDPVKIAHLEAHTIGVRFFSGELSDDRLADLEVFDVWIQGLRRLGRRGGSRRGGRRRDIDRGIRADLGGASMRCRIAAAPETCQEEAFQEKPPDGTAIYQHPRPSVSTTARDVPRIRSRPCSSRGGSRRRRRARRAGPRSARPRAAPATG